MRPNVCRAVLLWDLLGWDSSPKHPAIHRMAVPVSPVLTHSHVPKAWQRPHKARGSCWGKVTARLCISFMLSRRMLCVKYRTVLVWAATADTWVMTSAGLHFQCHRVTGFSCQQIEPEEVRLFRNTFLVSPITVSTYSMLEPELSRTGAAVAPPRQTVHHHCDHKGLCCVIFPLYWCWAEQGAQGLCRGKHSALYPTLLPAAHLAAVVHCGHTRPMNWDPLNTALTSYSHLQGNPVPGAAHTSNKSTTPLSIHTPAQAVTSNPGVTCSFPSTVFGTLDWNHCTQFLSKGKTLEQDLSVCF